MKPRAILIGLLLAIALATMGWWNDRILRQASVAEDLIPLSVFGLLVVAMLLVNPVIRVIPGLKLAGRDWSVIIGLMLMGAMIPGPGLMWHFTPIVAMPYRYNANNPGWQRDNLLDYAPQHVPSFASEGYKPLRMLVDPAPDGVPDESVVFGLVEGEGGMRPGERITFPEAPWSGWSRTLAFWLPLLGLGFIASVCVALVVHPQWAHRERLRYPVAEFASELINGSGDRPFPNIFYKRAFWLGMGPVMAVLLFNGFGPWFQIPINVPLQFDFTAITNRWPYLNNAPDLTIFTLRPRLSFVVIGFAFLVSTDVSFSMGISPILFSAVWLTVFSFGINPRGGGGYLGGSVEGYQKFGSYIGLALIIMYTGRYHFASVFLRSLGIRRGDPVNPSVLWASRLAMLSGLATMALLRWGVGLDLPLAGLYVVFAGVIILVLTRMNVETGMYSFHTWWHGAGAILGMFGAAAIGPHMLIILALLSTVATIDARVTLMPLVANALRIGEHQGVKATRFTWGLLPVALLCLVLGVVGTIFFQYSYGMGQVGWSGDVARMPWQLLQQNMLHFESRPEGATGMVWSLSHMNSHFLWSSIVGFGLVVGASALRLRYSWWPLHPVLFLLWGTWPMSVLGPSWLLGWFLKSVVVRIGGAAAFSHFKPWFIGIVAGDFTARIILAAYALGYYMITGVRGP